MAFENYIFPPRPENKIPADSLENFDKMKMFFAQPKLNGSCCVGIMHDSAGKTQFYNRHKEYFGAFVFNASELEAALPTTKLTIVVGEYLNKSQKDEFSKFPQESNGRFCLFDILVYDGQSLIGKTNDERQKILRDNLAPRTEYSKYMDRISDNLFIVKNFETDFIGLFNEITPIQVYEGLVLKKKNAKLEPGISESNNIKSMIKCRKPTKNYSH